MSIERISINDICQHISSKISPNKEMNSDNISYDDKLIMSPDPQETNEADRNIDEPEDNEDEKFLELSVSALRSIAADISDILDHIDQDDVKKSLTDPRLQGMIAVTETNANSIKDFVMWSRDLVDNSSSSGSGKNLPGLWENIRKKKEREGKNYKPAKPGDKGRPDPKTWKKLTKENQKD